jgi:hypothetical protein
MNNTTSDLYTINLQKNIQPGTEVEKDNLTSHAQETDTGGNHSSSHSYLNHSASSDAATNSSVESNHPAMTELQQINAIQRMSTNYVFLFGAQQRGKTVVTSSIMNFLSSADSEGDLSPFAVKKNQTDHGNELLQKILRTFAEQRFPERTVLVGEKEPIHMNVRFTPNNKRDRTALNFTFLEMPGDELRRIDAPDGGRGEFPVSIDVFFKTINTSISFILVTEHELAAEDDQLISSFINFVRHENKNFSDSRFLLLITKWDTYDGGLSIDEFIKLNMRLTHAKLHDNKHSVCDFSIGDVATAGGKAFLQRFNPVPSKQVINWLYRNITGKPMYKKTFWEKVSSKFMRYS